MAPAEAVARLRERGPATVIVTLGADGVQCADKHGNVHAPAPRTQAVDTTGASDTFIGAFAAARCAGVALHAAIAHAQQAAAFSVERHGTARHDRFDVARARPASGARILVKKTALLHGGLSRLVAGLATATWS